MNNKHNIKLDFSNFTKIKRVINNDYTELNWLDGESYEGKKLPNLVIKGKTTLPIIQGGMGVGISNWQLAGSVAKEGGIGTLSAVGQASTPAYKELYAQELQKKINNHGRKSSLEALNQLFYDTNLICIKEEIRKAKELSNGNGAIFINIMVATNDYDRQVITACEAGIDGIVSGAGLPLSLPELTKNYPNVALIPILSNLRGVKILIKKWEKLGKKPDAIVLEDPSTAGGHLGAASTIKVNEEESLLVNSVPEVIEYLKQNGLNIPVIAAGGIINKEDILKVIKLGASGVQMGTRFLASKESSASPEFKDCIIAADSSQIITYVSNAMLPARAIKESGIFETIKDRQATVKKCIENCLTHCAYRDGIGILKNTGESPAQMCILNALVKATEGNSPDAKKWALYFTGISAVKIDTIKSVSEIINSLK